MALAPGAVGLRGPADELRDITVRSADEAGEQPVALALLGRPIYEITPAAVRTENGERVAYVYVDLDEGADPVGYVESAGFSPDGARLLVVREARVAGRPTRKFQVLSASTLAVEIQCTDVTKLSAFKRWQAASWKVGTLALR